MGAGCVSPSLGAKTHPCRACAILERATALALALSSFLRSSALPFFSFDRAPRARAGGALGSGGGPLLAAGQVRWRGPRGLPDNNSSVWRGGGVAVALGLSETCAGVRNTVMGAFRCVCLRSPAQLREEATAHRSVKKKTGEELRGKKKRTETDRGPDARPSSPLEALPCMHASVPTSRFLPTPPAHWGMQESSPPAARHVTCAPPAISSPPSPNLRPAVLPPLVRFETLLALSPTHAPPQYSHSLTHTPLFSLLWRFSPHLAPHADSAQHRQ